MLPPPDASQAFVMLEQCRDVVLKIRRATKRIGVSLSLTYLLSLLEQCLDRIELLLYLVVDDSEGRYVSLGNLISDLTKAHYNEKVSARYSARPVSLLPFKSQRMQAVLANTM